MTELITFNLPMCMPAPNARLRQHWAKRRHTDGHLRLAMICALGGTLYLPPAPFKFARVTVMQRRLQLLDVDAIAASLKGMIDLLQPASKRHPMGLGIITGDDPAHCELIARQTRAAHRPDQRTIIVIEELPSIATPPRDLFAEALEMAGAWSA
jgi:hypothetical protein